MHSLLTALTTWDTAVLDNYTLAQEAQQHYIKLFQQEGIQRQLNQFSEEVAELTIELMKRMRGRVTVNAGIAEELADCLILFDQMMRFYGISKSDLDIALHEKLCKFNETMTKILKENP